MFHNRPNFRLLVLIAALIITAAVLTTDFDGSLGSEYGLKGALIVVVSGILMTVLLDKSPDRGASQNDRVSYLMKVSIVVLLLIGGVSGIMAVVSSYPELKIMRLVPQILLMAAVVPQGAYLQWLVIRDERREKSVFEPHLALAGLAVLALGVGMHFIMTTRFAHLFGY